MKNSLIPTLLLICTLASASISHAGPREDQRIQQGKITKNEAQHLVLKKYPGATIRKCVLQKSGEHSVWMVELITPGGKNITRVQVDGMSGQITP